MATALTRVGTRASGRRFTARTARRFFTRVAALVLVGAVGAPLPAQSSGPLRLQHGTAVFTARATFGPFTGVTTAVRGTVSSPSDARAATGWVEVTLDSLRTGNGTRDRHMRDALETTTHPTARFELDSVVFVPEASSATDSVRPVRLHGRFRVHGVARPVVADGTLQPRAPDGWQLAASFPVTLAEHEIRKGLSRALGTIRVQPVVQVRVELVFTP
ncbi:MAG TPA: YceI family protein [Gemmatimonadaceae bacterium]|nr:YceI family protein [Gemmatimonadaceae bacterium]